MQLPKQILAPTDFSTEAERSVEQAFVLAQAVGAKVHLLHAYSLPAYAEGAVMVSRLIRELFEASEAQLNRLAERLRPTGHLGELVLKLGDPRDVILQTASDMHIDLIVMSTHGRRGLRRAMLGSVAESVVRAAPCSVWVVRAHG